MARDMVTMCAEGVTIIDLQENWDTCIICERDTPLHWGVPVYEGLIVDNNWPFEWFGAPACKTCHDEHAQGEHVQLKVRKMTDLYTQISDAIRAKHCDGDGTIICECGDDWICACGADGKPCRGCPECTRPCINHRD